MRSGTVIGLVLEKGYGFIHEQSGSPDVFFHCSELADDLPFDERLKERRVQFDVTEDGRGPRAVNVQAAE